MGAAAFRHADAGRCGGGHGKFDVGDENARKNIVERTRLASRRSDLQACVARGGCRGVQSLQPAQARGRRSGSSTADHRRHIPGRQHRRFHAAGRTGAGRARRRSRQRNRHHALRRERSVTEGEVMTRQSQFKIALLGTVCLAGSAQAEIFNVPEGDLRAALSAYSNQAHVQLMVSDEAVKGTHSKGATGDLSADMALLHILKGTGFTAHRISSGAIGIVHDATQSRNEMLPDPAPMELAQASPSSRGAIETVTVTSSKLGGADVQSIPIAITALSQEQLTATQTAGGPDLVKQVPNLTFSKTNFTGYNVQIRGIGTQAISVTTDPAVAVALNDIPFIRNHFFEQEFYDVNQVEVLRGPQGTLYGRNATAGVVNLSSAKPTDQFEAMLSADMGNYNNRRFEGMVNVPIVDDRLDIRAAGEWTKRDGYSFDDETGRPVDGRDLWSAVSPSVGSRHRICRAISS